MTKIKASKILFIKLGHNGDYEDNCIMKNQTLRLGYLSVDHQNCINRKWDLIHNYFLIQENSKNFVATNHTNQIRQFYEEDENTLWITFYLNKLWWCYSNLEITLLPDGSKTRPVIGKWSDKDINGNDLILSSISGKLLKTQGFRGTICKVKEEEYTLRKINCEQSKEALEVEIAIAELKSKMTSLIQHLQWKDFETLIDLIFRAAGWQRISEKGKTQKTLDLELLSPVTGESAIVQIKSQSNLKEFEYYQETFAKMNNYDKFFFIVHTEDSSLSNYNNETETNLFLVNKIAELTISSGLSEWVIKKTS